MVRQSQAMAVRIGGVGLLALVWLGGRLVHHAAAPAPHQTAATLLTTAAIFVGASLGMALTILGPGLWQQVEVPGRWFYRDPSVKPWRRDAR